MAEEEKSGARVAGFGRYLLQERELRGLTREEVSRLTKLAPMVIDALESGDPQRMPPRAYLIGYLRSYAGAVGLDPDEVVLRWQEAAGSEEPQPAFRSRRNLRRWTLMAAVAAAVAAAAILGLVFRPRRASGQRLHPPAEQTEQPVPAAEGATP